MTETDKIIQWGYCLMSALCLATAVAGVVFNTYGFVGGMVVILLALVRLDKIFKGETKDE